MNLHLKTAKQCLLKQKCIFLNCFASLILVNDTYWNISELETDLKHCPWANTSTFSLCCRITESRNFIASFTWVWCSVRPHMEYQLYITEGECIYSVHSRLFRLTAKSCHYKCTHLGKGKNWLSNLSQFLMFLMILNNKKVLSKIFKVRNYTLIWVLKSADDQVFFTVSLYLFSYFSLAIMTCILVLMALTLSLSAALPLTPELALVFYFSSLQYFSYSCSSWNSIKSTLPLLTWHFVLA